MKKGTKIALIVAGILLVVGLVICAAVLATTDWDSLSWNTEAYEIKTEIIDQPFSDIRILAAEADIHLMLATDGVCRVEHPESEHTGYDIIVQNGLLAIEYRNTRKWYQFLSFDFSSFNREVRVYLPQSQYDAAMLHTASGDIAVDYGVDYKTAKCTTASGDIAWHAKVTDNCSLTSTSGDILLHDTKVSGDVNLITTSGKCTATAIQCGSFSAKCTSGDMVLANITAGNLTAICTSGEITLANSLGQTMVLENTSGDIEFTNCDGNDITLTTVSGDIEGTLFSGKIFECDTVSGDIEVPPISSASGVCKVKTVSGDVEIDIA